MSNDGYFSFRNPLDGKTKGLGRDKANAFHEARQANQELAAMKSSSLVQWIRGGDAVTLSAWLPEYRKVWIEQSKPAESTISNADKHIKRLKGAPFAHLEMPKITTVHLSRYLDELVESSGNGSAANIRARLLDIFAFAITKGHVATNPVEPTMLPKYEAVRGRLSLDQFKALRDKAEPWLANAMNLALLSGQRVSDVASMKFADVKHGYLHVTPKKAQGKTKVKYAVDIGLLAVDLTIADVIKQCRDRVVSQYLIHQPKNWSKSKAGDPFNERSISVKFSEVRGELGIVGSDGRTPPTFHEIRSLSERLYREQYGKDFAQAMLGHKTANMTAEYDDLRGSGWAEVKLK
jgi:integrase